MIEPAPFDSQCYGLTIGRVAAHAALLREPARVIDAAREQGYAMVAARLPEGCPLARALAAEGHTPVDTLVTSALWDRTLQPVAAADVEITHVTAVTADADLAAIAEVTAAAIVRTRFHADRRLPHDATILLVEAWAVNDARGRAQRMVLARRAGRVVGYLAALETPERVAIDLVAVHPSLHGRGIGGALLASFVDAYLADARMLTVGTQRDNPALALYQRHGFKDMQTEVTYHLWTTP